MKFRKKPVVIDAVQWFKFGDHPAVRKHLVGDEDGCVVDTGYGMIDTLESAGPFGHKVTPGDWIITGVKGEHYACKPDIFALTYEADTARPEVAANDTLPRYHCYLGQDKCEFPLDGGWQMKRSENGAWVRFEDVRAILSALRPFAELGGPDDGSTAAFHDIEDDALVYENSGKCITAGDVRAARKLVSRYAQPIATAERMRSPLATKEKP